MNTPGDSGCLCWGNMAVPAQTVPLSSFINYCTRAFAAAQERRLEGSAFFAVVIWLVNCVTLLVTSQFLVSF